MRNRREELRRPGEGGARTGSRGRGAGAPQPLGFRAVVLRAVFAAVVFYAYVVIVTDLDAGQSLTVALLAFLLMIPVGWAMDRVVYRLRLRRWQRRAGNG